MWIWKIVVCTSLSAAVNIEGQFTFPEPPRLPELANATFADLEWSQPLLNKRQGTCYSPNRWCSDTSQCCGPNTNRCCRSGACGQSTGGDCCGRGQCNADKPKCCSDNGCIAENDACCGTEGYCPAPFRCYERYRNNVYIGLTCCTDSSCDVYLSDGATLTRTTTAAQTVAPATMKTTLTQTTTAAQTVAPVTTKTTAPQLPATTTARVETDLDYYSTTVYWTYYYYYYTLQSAFLTETTTRVRTTVSSTTTLTCQAADTYAAQAIFLSLSSDLPTPTEALVTPPVTPTAGAPIRGSCSPIGTTSVCETLIAGALTSPTVSGDGPRSVAASSCSVSALARSMAMFCAILRLVL